jgi:hypothetical protein
LFVNVDFVDGTIAILKLSLVIDVISSHRIVFEKKEHGGWVTGDLEWHEVVQRRANEELNWSRDSILGNSVMVTYCLRERLVGVLWAFSMSEKNPDRLEVKNCCAMAGLGATFSGSLTQPLCPPYKTLM